MPLPDDYLNDLLKERSQGRETDRALTDPTKQPAPKYTTSALANKQSTNPGVAGTGSMDDVAAHDVKQQRWAQPNLQNSPTSYVQQNQNESRNFVNTSLQNAFKPREYGNIPKNTFKQMSLDKGAAGTALQESQDSRDPNATYFGNSGDFLSYDRIQGANKGNTKKYRDNLYKQYLNQIEGVEKEGLSATQKAYDDANGGIAGWNSNNRPSANFGQQSGLGVGSTALGPKSTSVEALTPQKLTSTEDVANATWDGSEDISGYFDKAREMAAGARDGQMLGSQEDLAAFLAKNAAPGYTDSMASLDSNMITAAPGESLKDLSGRFKSLDALLMGEQQKAQGYSDSVRRGVMTDRSMAQAKLDQVAAEKAAEQARLEEQAQKAREAQKRHYDFEKYQKDDAASVLRTIVRRTSLIHNLANAMGFRDPLDRAGDGVESWIDPSGEHFNSRRSRFFADNPLGEELWGSLTPDEWTEFNNMSEGNQIAFINNRKDAWLAKARQEYNDAVARKDTDATNRARERIDYLTHNDAVRNTGG